jgi:maltodextrin utilization protein YvdJ
MATLKKQKADGEWEYVQVVGSKVIADFEQNQAENTLWLYKSDVTATDTNGNPTEVEYRRKADNTLAIKRSASNPDTNGFYQTVVEQFYNTDGVTVYKTVTYTFSYLENGLIDTSDGGVIS